MGHITQRAQAQGERMIRPSPGQIEATPVWGGGGEGGDRLVR